MALPTFLRKLTTKVVEPTTFDVVPAEQSGPGPAPCEGASGLHTLTRARTVLEMLSVALDGRNS